MEVCTCLQVTNSLRSWDMSNQYIITHPLSNPPPPIALSQNTKLKQAGLHFHVYCFGCYIISWHKVASGVGWHLYHRLGPFRNDTYMTRRHHSPRLKCFVKLFIYHHHSKGQKHVRNAATLNGLTGRFVCGLFLCSSKEGS